MTSRAEQARVERSKDRAALADLADDADASPPVVLAAVHAELARSEAGLVLVGSTTSSASATPSNLPGTGRERPNWQRRTRATLEEIVVDPSIHAALAPLREHRGRGVPAPTKGLSRTPETVFGVSRLGAADVHLFNEGRHFRLYEKLGAHPMAVNSVAGTYFAVWAPNAERVAVVGDFNDWNGERYPLAPHGSSGIWEGFVPGVEAGARYKYRLRSQLGGPEFDKADPFAQWGEAPPGTASSVWSPTHQWSDDEWMQARTALQRLDQPISVYEVHLGSWRRVPEEGNRPLTYRELAPRLVEYVLSHGFTHVEMLPVMEHPFYGSWGYQVTGYFAPSARYGTPDDFAALIDELHRAGIGVILDWVPSHFPADAFALGAVRRHAPVRTRRPAPACAPRLAELDLQLRAKRGAQLPRE